MAKQYFIYIMTNKLNTVLYTGITNNLPRRIYEHKNKIGSKFTQKYNINKLIYYEVFSVPEVAIAREKQIKGGSRERKLKLIRWMNPGFRDLSEDF
ncbi:GIY-YIG nuclease family protein [bacterium]|nr:GIY-YIG nuclease family protein [bacterium]